ncbi:MAG: HORMA-1 domain-containing protein [Rhodanobacter sp.]
MSATFSQSDTYSVTDIEDVMRRVATDFVMLASSTGTVSEEKARNWAHDVGLLAKKGYLSSVDLTLLKNGVEIKATRFSVDATSGELTNDRPGGLMWPRMSDATLRIVLFYTDAYDAEAQQSLAGKMKIGWVTTTADTSHAGLAASQGREYASGGYGIQRRDYV